MTPLEWVRANPGTWPMPLHAVWACNCRTREEFELERDRAELLDARRAAEAGKWARYAAMPEARGGAR